MNKIDLTTLLADQDLGTPSGRITQILSERGSLSATQIARLTGLAKSTVSMTLSDLRRSGIVVDREIDKAGGAGRPATKLTLNPEAGTCVGVLIGLNVIQVVVADVSHAIIDSITEDLEYDYSPQKAAGVIRDLIQRSYARHALSLDGLLGVGVAIAGPVNPTDGKVQRASVVPTWAGVDVREVFGPLLKRPILTDNESNCAALAEMTWGAAMGREDFVLFKIDGGIGGAIVHQGTVLKGVAGGGGEFGHMVIDPDGALCRCGNRGCLELSASFRAVLERNGYRQGNLATMDLVIEQALAGDPRAQGLIADTASAAGRGLAMIGTVINPPLIVIGGRLALAGQLLLEPLIASYDKYTLVKRNEVPPEARTQIVVGKFTRNDSCLGAVGMVLRHHGQARN